MASGLFHLFLLALGKIKEVVGGSEVLSWAGFSVGVISGDFFGYSSLPIKF